MKTHLSFGTSDLAGSVRFYTTLLGAEAVKHYDDYALFVTEAPALELALNPATTIRHDGEEHYGIAVDSPDQVDTAIARMKAAGFITETEHEQTCCYAEQNKVWATDPDGRRWETYYVIAESQQRDGNDPECCAAEASAGEGAVGC